MGYFFPLSFSSFHGTASLLSPYKEEWNDSSCQLPLKPHQLQEAEANREEKKNNISTLPFPICSVLFSPDTQSTFDIGVLKADEENDGSLLVGDEWELLALWSCSRTGGQDLRKWVRDNEEKRKKKEWKRPYRYDFMGNQLLSTIWHSSQERNISLILISYPQIGCCYNVTAFKIANNLNYIFFNHFLVMTLISRSLG